MPDAETMTIPRADYEQLKKAQAGQDRKNAELQAEIKRLQGDLAKYKGYGGGEAAVAERLDRIERAYQAKEAALSLNYYVKSRSLDLGLDARLFEGLTFGSQDEAEAHLVKLAEYRQAVLDEDITRKMISGEKPRAAGDPPPKPKADEWMGKQLAGIIRG